METTTGVLIEGTGWLDRKLVDIVEDEEQVEKMPLAVTFDTPLQDGRDKTVVIEVTRAELFNLEQTSRKFVRLGGVAYNTDHILSFWEIDLDDEDEGGISSSDFDEDEGSIG